MALCRELRARLFSGSRWSCLIAGVKVAVRCFKTLSRPPRRETEASLRAETARVWVSTPVRHGEAMKPLAPRLVSAIMTGAGASAGHNV